MKATGEGGELRVGHQCAARLGRWSFEATKTLAISFEVRARVVSKDEYWMQESPMTLALFLGTSRWEWQNIRVSLEMGDVVVKVTGKPEILKEAIHA